MNQMKTLITRLFAEAAPLDNPLVKMLRESLPANAKPVFLECQLVLKSGYAVAGILTTAPEPDMLRLVAVAQRPDKSVVIADHLFAYEDVLTIVIGREMPVSPIQPVGRPNGSPIILGH